MPEIMEKSPCLDCPNNLSGIDKRLCLNHCKRLAAYQNGHDWTKEEVFIVLEGKDLIEDLEKNLEPDVEPGIDGIDELEENEEIDDEEEAPGPVKHIPPEPEASWKKRLTLQGGGRKPVVVDAEKRCCAICGKSESHNNKFFRGVCRKPCYNQWYSGKVKHPVLGKFKKGSREIMQTKKETDKIAKINTPKHGRPAVTDDICLTTININLELYPQILDAVYRIAVNLSLPVSHIAVTLLGEALAARRKAE